MPSAARIGRLQCVGQIGAVRLRLRCSVRKLTIEERRGDYDHRAIIQHSKGNRMRQPFGSLLATGLIAALLIFAPPPAPAQVAETAVAGVAFEALSQSLNKKVKEAFDQGNFLVWNAGVQARLTLDR